MATVAREIRLIGAAGKVRTAMLHGRKHLVIPVIALMEGVIHAVNAESPEFVPGEVLTKCASSWNGRPLVLFHPTANGEQISANSPEVIEQRGFGTIFSSVGKGKRLSMEAWIDPERLKTLGQLDLLSDIELGKPIEVSVGASVAVSPGVGEYNGRYYSGKWVYASGDHLAFLPGGKGACSVEMGCGAMRSAAANVVLDSEIIALRDISQKEHDEMTESDFAGPDQTYPIQKPEDVYSASKLYGKSSNPAKVKARIIAIAKRKGPKFVAQLPAAWQSKKRAAERNSTMSVNRSLRERLRALLPELKALMDTPEAAAAEEKAELIAYQSMRTLHDSVGASWDEISGLIDELIADEEENPTETPGQEEAEEEVEQARLLSIQMLAYSMMSSLQNIVSVTYAQMAPDIEPSDPRYAEAVRAAAGKEISAKNQKTIQAAHDASHSMHTNTVALGAACTGMKVLAGKPCGCGGHRSAEEINVTKKEKIEALLKHEHNTVKDVKVLEAASDEVLSALEANAEALKTAAKKTTDAEAETAVAKKATTDAEAKVTALSAKPKTEEEFLKDAPESIKSLVANHKAAEETAKTELVTKLKAAGAFTEDELKAKSLEELTKLATLAKVEVTADFSVRGVPTPRAASAPNAGIAAPDGYAAALGKK